MRKEDLYEKLHKHPMKINDNREIYSKSYGNDGHHMKINEHHEIGLKICANNETETE